MKLSGLKLRLLLGAAAWIASALVLAGVVIAYLFAEHVERSAQADMQAQLDRLVALIDATPDVPVVTQPLADPRFNVPLGGLYWQITDAETSVQVRSRSLWDQKIDLGTINLVPGGLSYFEIPGPEGAPIFGLVRRLEFGDQPPLRTLDVTVAESRAPMEAAVGAFRFDLARALIILGTALIVAAWLQTSIGLRPLGTIRAGIAAIRQGRSNRLEGDFPDEVQPLVTEVNALMESQDASIAFARDRAADLAHGLKTSLTVLNVQAESLRRKHQVDTAEAIESLTQDMAGTIDHQLRLARLRLRTRLDHYSSDLAEHVGKVLTTIRKTPRGTALDWAVDTEDGLIVDIDSPDLTELLGILCDNATKWASTRVAVASSVADDAVVLTIADDGPGLSPDKLAALGKRGVRLDETKSGTGIGLAIARDIVRLNRAEITFARSANLGGLEVRLRLPRAQTHGRTSGTG